MSEIVTWTDAQKWAAVKLAQKAVNCRNSTTVDEYAAMMCGLIANSAHLFAPVASAPVEAGTAALDRVLKNAETAYNLNDARAARAELLALKRAAAGRDAVLEECAAICDRAAREWPREPASANDAAFRIRAMQSPPATGEKRAPREEAERGS